MIVLIVGFIFCLISMIFLKIACDIYRYQKKNETNIFWRLSEISFAISFIAYLMIPYQF